MPRSMPAALTTVCDITGKPLYLGLMIACLTDGWRYTVTAVGWGKVRIKHDRTGKQKYITDGSMFARI